MGIVATCKWKTNISERDVTERTSLKMACKVAQMQMLSMLQRLIMQNLFFFLQHGYLLKAILQQGDVMTQMTH